MNIFESEVYQPVNPASTSTLLIWRNTILENIPSLSTLLVLFKMRIVALLLVAAMGGAFLGAEGWPGSGAMILLVITGGFAAAGSSALNQYFERESDSLMKRTKTRPLVDGTISRPEWVPYVASAMILVPSLLVLPFNPALTFFLLFGAAIYVLLYTLYLKPRTLLNIVIGGAAGSAAVLSGGAAAGNWNDPGVVVLALLLFLWTPTHFWSLAIVYRDDYARSDTPMLPVKTTSRKAAFCVFLHTVATGLAALILGTEAVLGWIYLLPVGIATIDILVRNIKLLIHPTAKLAFSLFKASNFYLLIVILTLGIDAVVL